MLRPALLALVFLVLAALFVHLGGLRVDSDFFAMYAATHGVVNGVSPWDELGQAALLNAEYPELDEPISVLPFGYPPWYVLLTWPLGLLAPGPAGRAFLLLNLGWLCLAVWALVPRGAEVPRVLAAALLTAVYTPVLGLLVVGQYTLPVLAGGAVGLVALRRRQPWLVAAALLLLSFKWHVGGLVGLGLCLALARDRALLKGSVLPTAATFAAACLLGLLLDPAWPVTYARSVLALSAADVNQVCDTCSSLAWFVGSRAGVGAFGPGLALLALGALAIGVRRLHTDPAGLLAASVPLALLALPYVRNYDYAVLPLALVLAHQRSRHPAEHATVALVWLAPVVLPLLDRGAADEVLGGSALALLALLLAQGPRPARADPGA